MREQPKCWKCGAVPRVIWQDRRVKLESDGCLWLSVKGQHDNFDLFVGPQREDEAIVIRLPDGGDIEAVHVLHPNSLLLVGPGTMSMWQLVGDIGADPAARIDRVMFRVVPPTKEESK